MSEPPEKKAKLGDADAAESVVADVKEKVGSRQCETNTKYTKKDNPDLKALTGREKEFQELGDLTKLYDGLATKTRQHVNPLSSQFQKPTPAPKWEEVFVNPSLPLQIDVGCGSGRFVLIRALRAAGRGSSADAELDATAPPPVEEDANEDKATPSSAANAEAGSTGTGSAGGSSSSSATANVLGLEIRLKLVERASIWAKRVELSNCAFIHTNATVSWKSLFESYPGRVDLVSMQFPDPHFKSKHRKRRHVQPLLAREMAEIMAVGSRVFLQGDVPEIVRWMRDIILEHGSKSFAVSKDCQGGWRDEWESPADADDARDAGVERVRQMICDKGVGWLNGPNPMGVPTEREVYVAQIKAPVYRVMLDRIEAAAAA